MWTKSRENKKRVNVANVFYFNVYTIILCSRNTTFRLIRNLA